jgi:hypothetical protein
MFTLYTSLPFTLLAYALCTSSLLPVERRMWEYHVGLLTLSAASVAEETHHHLARQANTMRELYVY